MGSEVEHVLEVQDRLGEGARWNVDEQALYWVDIRNNCFHRLYPATGEHQVVDVGVPIGVLAQRASGGLVMATQRGFALWHPGMAALRFIADPEAGQPDKRFNDGAVDCAGRFWAGTMCEPLVEHGKGVLYRLDPDHSVHVMETGLEVPNGIGWSLDNRTMYFTDSEQYAIFAYDFDPASGDITNRRHLVYTPGDPAVPDGLAVDSEGFIWSAYWNGAKVVRYSPGGQVERVISVPALCPTSCAFGGANLDELYITSAWDELDEEQRQRYPLSGDLFRVKVGIKGLENYKFAG